MSKATRATISIVGLILSIVWIFHGAWPVALPAAFFTFAVWAWLSELFERDCK